MRGAKNTKETFDEKHYLYSSDHGIPLKAKLMFESVIIIIIIITAL